MYTIIIVGIIGIIIGIYLNVREWGWNWGDNVLGALAGAFIGCIIGICVALALPVKYEVSYWSQNIVTLKDNNSVDGRFFLGCGQISGSMKYVYYQQNDDSTYQMWQCDYYDAKIKYSNTQPKIDITDVHYKNNFYNNFALDWTLDHQQTYTFEVPKGTIKTEYQLDAQ